MFLIRLLVILFLFLNVRSDSDLNLEKVVILSRHNVRTPLAKDLKDITPKTWPKWKEKRGYLTAKGVLLEGFMGEYFSQWLRQHGLLSEECPREETFFAYANIAQRALASAHAFVNKSFPGCNINIHHSLDQNDPMFNPVIHNSSTAFIQLAKDDMLVLLKSLHLNSSYEILENILDYKQSKLCIKEGKCDLTIDKNKIGLKFNAKPNVSGPLKISKSAIDSFIMEYYEGFPLSEVAWGSLHNTYDWYSILNLSRGYHHVIFNTTIIAKDISKPLLSFMSEIFLNDKTSPKITFLMGHDANLYTVINSLGFKPYILRNQYEVIPIGGKLVFQKYYNRKTNNFVLKVDYVYQCTEDMRNSRPLSLVTPPEFVTLELKDCPIDSNGYCLWDDFKRILTSL